MTENHISEEALIEAAMGHRLTAEQEAHRLACTQCRAAGERNQRVVDDVNRALAGWTRAPQLSRDERSHLWASTERRITNVWRAKIVAVGGVVSAAIVLAVFARALPAAWPWLAVSLALGCMTVYAMPKYAAALLVPASVAIAWLQPSNADIVLGYSGLACLRMELVFGISTGALCATLLGRKTDRAVHVVPTIAAACAASALLAETVVQAGCHAAHDALHTMLFHVSGVAICASAGKPLRFVGRQLARFSAHN